jgi:cell division septation protein DedD
MMATRRLSRAHHEFRFGRRELAVLGAVFGLIASLVFIGGVVVGREMSRSKARAEVPRESRLTEPDGYRGGDTVKTAATRAEEKVTFYRTLTAPTQDLPQVGKPTVEERMVPKDEPVPTPAADGAPAVAAPAEPRGAAPEASRTEPEAPRAAPERKTPKAPAPDAAHPPPRATRPARVGAPQPARAPAQVAAASATSEPEMWTVQVNAFRSRALAEELRARLAARGFDAYVFPSLTEDGRPRYRVRVGAYPARSDAERAATELRSERGLNPLVTPRTTR